MPQKYFPLWWRSAQRAYDQPGRTDCTDTFFATVSAAIRHCYTLDSSLMEWSRPKQGRIQWIGLVTISSETEANRQGLFRQWRWITDAKSILLFEGVTANDTIWLQLLLLLTEERRYERYRWRQVEEEADAGTERVALRVLIPETTELYSSFCAMIDRPNKYKQGSRQSNESDKETGPWDLVLLILGLYTLRKWKTQRLPRTSILGGQMLRLNQYRASTCSCRMEFAASAMETLSLIWMNEFLDSWRGQVGSLDGVYITWTRRTIYQIIASKV